MGENHNILTKKRNKVLDVYKGILIIFVVLRHVLQYSVVDEGGILTNFIWAVQMPGFMLISGYFSARKIDNFSDVKKRILLSTQHYALPFLAWFILINIILLGEYNHSLVRGIKELFNHIDVGLWFLWVIFILSLIAAICNWIESVKGNYFNVLVFYIIFVIILVGIAALFGMNFCGIKLILYYSIFYGIGWGGKKNRKILDKILDKIS